MANCYAFAQERCVVVLSQHWMMQSSSFLNIPREFQAPTEDGKVVLYRGDLRGHRQLGMVAKAVLSHKPELVQNAMAIVNSGDRAGILKLIDKHTTGSVNSPFLSATFNPKLAQIFATKEKTTIYKLRIDPRRVILDATNLGKSDEGGEVLILGGVLPSEIEAIKIRNGDFESELFYVDEYGTSLISMRYDDHPDRKNRNVQDPKNWFHLRK